MKTQIIFGLFWFVFFVVSAEEVSSEDNAKAAEFLGKFGYLSVSRSGNRDTKAALGKYQRFFHLPVTGVLDDATKKEMAKPRCGNTDSQTSRAWASKWYKSRLTYRLLNYSPDMSRYDIQSTIEKAFQIWSRVVPLTFSRVNSGNADFNIVFGRRNHGDYYPFDGRGRTLAHAFFPRDGRVHFDEDEYWGIKGRGTDLLWVAVHEIGHALGLSHSDFYGAIMYPTYGGYKPNVRLHRNDIDHIRRLYS